MTRSALALAGFGGGDDGGDDIPLSNPIVDRLDELARAERYAVEAELYRLVPDVASLPDRFAAIWVGPNVIEPPGVGPAGWKFTISRHVRVIVGVNEQSVHDQVVIFERMLTWTYGERLQPPRVRDTWPHGETVDVELLWVRREGAVVPELVATYLGHPMRPSPEGGA